MSKFLSLWCPLITKISRARTVQDRLTDLSIGVISMPSSFGRDNGEAAPTYRKQKRRCW